MSRVARLHVPIDGQPATGADSVEIRVRTVLETRPGTLPWRPEFGCAVHELLGRPLTAQTRSEAEWHVTAALRRWLPDLPRPTVRARVLPVERLGEGGDNREIDLYSLGVRAILVIDVELHTARGPVHVQSALAP